VTLEDLRVFDAVCEARNLSTVAHALGRTQPAVAQHVARLERELGVRLLDRTRKGVVATPAGLLLHRATSAGLGAIALATREIRRLRDGEAGRLAIATGGTTVRHFLAEAVRRFRRRHPDVTLHFEPVNSTRQGLAAVARRGADLAFITVAGDLEGFEVRPLMEQPLVLLVHRDDPLASRTRVRLRDLRTIRWIALSESTTSQGLIRRAMQEAGLVLSPTARVDDFDTAHVFVELGLGHAIVPAIQGRSFVRSGTVKTIAILGLPPIPIGWAARTFRLLPPVSVAFMDILAETAVAWKRIPRVRLLGTR
jgi:DNA-binding transcriptional LysR family regulator